MRHAILITAYTDFTQLVNLIEVFDARFDIYIHIDKNAKVSDTFIRELRSLSNVKMVDSVFTIKWGGRNHIDAILWLCKQALRKSPDVNFFHLISGADFLVKTTDTFCKFFDSHPKNNYLDYFSLPYKGWDQGGLNRLEFNHPLDRINIKSAWGYSVYKRYLNWQIKKGYVRTLPPYNIYGGSSWWSLTREAISFICSHYNWNGWYDRIKNCFAPDEIYIQTLLLNSKYKTTIVNNNLRYILWKYKNGNCPAILDKSDLPDILKSKAFFARKIDSRRSKDLLSYFFNERNETAIYSSI